MFATLPGADPTGFAFGPNGDVYVAAYKTSNVRRLSATGAAIDIPVPFRAAGLLGPDNGITFGPDGNLYVPGYDSNSVVRYDPRTGATSVAVPGRTQGLGHTRGLLPERDGTGILITGEGSNQLLRLDLATGAVTVRNGTLNQPTGLDFAPDGSLLVLERDRVRRLDPATGAVLGVFIPAGSAHVDFGTYLAVIPFANPPPKATVVEFYNAALDHYFVSALPADIAALDSGNLKGWARTGRTFNAYAGAAAGDEPGLPLLPAARQRRLALLLGVARGVRGGRREVSGLRLRIARRDAHRAAGPRDRRVPGRPREGLPAVEQPRGFQSSLHDRRRGQGGDGRARLRRGGLRAGRDDHVRGGVNAFWHRGGGVSRAAGRMSRRLHRIALRGVVQPRVPDPAGARQVGRYAGTVA